MCTGNRIIIFPNYLFLIGNNLFLILKANWCNADKDSEAAIEGEVEID